LKARKQAAEREEIRRKKEFLTRGGGEYLGDDDDLLESNDDIKQDDPGEMIPDEVAWTMFQKYMGLQGQHDMDDLPHSYVYKQYHIFLYMLARGLLSDYNM
jgi:hypothetical protein